MPAYIGSVLLTTFHFESRRGDKENVLEEGGGSLGEIIGRHNYSKSVRGDIILHAAARLSFGVFVRTLRNVYKLRYHLKPPCAYTKGNHPPSPAPGQVCMP